MTPNEQAEESDWADAALRVFGECVLLECGWAATCLSVHQWPVGVAIGLPIGVVLGRAIAGGMRRIVKRLLETP